MARKRCRPASAMSRPISSPSFSHRDAWELGHALVSACEQMGAPLAVEIEVNHVIVFRYYPDGTGAYHEQWLRRKRNLVNLLEKSSQRAFYELEVNHEDLERDWLLPRSDYAACSGAFPIRIRGGSVIGVAAVSGLPDPGDQIALLTRPPRLFRDPSGIKSSRRHLSAAAFRFFLIPRSRRQGRRLWGSGRGRRRRSRRACRARWSRSRLRGRSGVRG